MKSFAVLGKNGVWIPVSSMYNVIFKLGAQTCWWVFIKIVGCASLICYTDIHTEYVDKIYASYSKNSLNLASSN